MSKTAMVFKVGGRRIRPPSLSMHLKLPLSRSLQLASIKILGGVDMGRFLMTERWYRSGLSSQLAVLGHLTVSKVTSKETTHVSRANPTQTSSPSPKPGE